MAKGKDNGKDDKEGSDHTYGTCPPIYELNSQDHKDGKDGKDGKDSNWYECQTTSSEPPTTSTKVPFFTNPLGLSLGMLGAVGGVFLVLRRRT